MINANVEVGAAALDRCTRNCEARQVYVSTEAKGDDQWGHVDAVCMLCGRRAGRSACLVKIDPF